MVGRDSTHSHANASGDVAVRQLGTRLGKDIVGEVETSRLCGHRLLCLCIGPCDHHSYGAVRTTTP